MPTYEYLCRKCGYRFEKFQSISEEPIKICPECKAKAAERLLHGGSGLIFKGSGFYITDYKKSKAAAGSNGNGSKKTKDKKKEKTTTTSKSEK